MAYTNGLKNKVIAAVQGGMPKTVAAKTFKVSAVTIAKWSKQRAHNGDAPAKAARQPRQRRTIARQLVPNPFAAENQKLRNLLVNAMLELTNHGTI